MAEKPQPFPRRKWALFDAYQRADPSLTYGVWISWVNEIHFDELAVLGYRKTQKSFTNRQLRKVLELLGEP